MSRRGAVGAIAVAALAALAAGCGSSGHGGGSANSATRATGTGAGAAAAAATVANASSTSSARSRSAQATAPRGHRHRDRDRDRGYGKLPSWLPSAKPPPRRPLRASFSHPRLTLQGESLQISFGGARLLATAVGPSVPEIGHTPVPATSPVTFVVTFSRVSSPLPLRRASFVLVDEQHRIHHPRMTALNGGAPPVQLRPGPPVSIKLHAVLPSGDGGLEWRPTGGRAIAGWDFNVEID